MIERTDSYFGRAVRTPRKVIEEARENLRGTGADTLVTVGGLSGAIIVPWMAEELGLNWYVVRKQDDHSHGGRMGVGRIGHKWVFVDDFISGGTTMRRAIDIIEQLVNATSQPHAIKLLGAYQYQNDKPWEEVTQDRDGYQIPEMIKPHNARMQLRYEQQLLKSIEGLIGRPALQAAVDDAVARIRAGMTRSLVSGTMSS